MIASNASKVGASRVVECQQRPNLAGATNGASGERSLAPHSSLLSYDLQGAGVYVTSAVPETAGSTSGCPSLCLRWCDAVPQPGHSLSVALRELSSGLYRLGTMASLCLKLHGLCGGRVLRTAIRRPPASRFTCLLLHARRPRVLPHIYRSACAPSSSSPDSPSGSQLSGQTVA